jgi:hypothetical protein
MKRHALTLGIVVALGLVCAPGIARAQDPPPADSAAEARQQYQLGTQAFKDKRYSEAALHFEAAAGFRVNAVALYTAGLAWDLAAKPERAADAYARSLEVPGLDAKQSGVAKERVMLLEKTLGTLAVHAPEGWKVQLDTFSEVPVPARLHGTPGVHALSVRSPGHGIEKRDVAVEAGKVTVLELKDEPQPAPEVKPEPKPSLPPAPAPVALQESFWTLRRVAGVGVAGLGVAALGATAILGINANEAGDAYAAAPTRAGFDHASSLQTWTNVALVSGLVLAAGGAVLVFWPDKTESRVHMGLGPTGASLGGRF